MTEATTMIVLIRMSRAVSVVPFAMKLYSPDMLLTTGCMTRGVVVILMSCTVLTSLP